MLYSPSSSKLLESLSSPLLTAHIQSSAFPLRNAAQSQWSRPPYLFATASTGLPIGAALLKRLSTDSSITPFSFMCLGERRGAGTLRSLEFEISFLPLRSPKHTLMLGKKTRIVGQTVLFACVGRTWRNCLRKCGGFPIQRLNYDAATLPVVRKTAPARVTLLSAWQITSAICFLHSSSVASRIALASDAR